MKMSDIAEIFRNYDDASWSPSRMSVNLGCDCGCGGDAYTIERWNEEEDAADEAIQKMKDFCQKFGIEYDGIE